MSRDEHEDELEIGRKIDRDPDVAESIGAAELERELTVAAAGAGRRRLTRFLRLLLERARRGHAR